MHARRSCPNPNSAPAFPPHRARGGAWLAALTIGALALAPATLAAPPLSDTVTPVPPPPPPLQSNADTPPASAKAARGFDVRGLLQKATVTPCTADARGRAQTAGGEAWVNGLRFTIPCNTMVLLPGTTMSWGDLFGTADERPAVNLTLNGEPNGEAQPAFTYPGIEIRLVGNFVRGAAISGLVSLGLPGTMRGRGYITSIDYKGGRLGVSGAPGGRDEVIVEINDPVITDMTDPAFGRGRFSSGQSADARFSADQSSPSIRAASGFPMCIPRSDPAVADDPLCPQRNRPDGNSPACRTPAQAGIVASGTTRQQAGSQFEPQRKLCSTFVMKYPPGTPLDARGSFVRADGSVIANATVADASEPDARHMVPFAVGDFISYSGLLLHASGTGANQPAAGAADIISAHTVEANLGVFTSPGSLPVYAAVREVAIGVDTSASASSPASGVAQDITNRIVIDGVVTDPTAIADLYFVDLEPGDNITGFPRPGRRAGQENHRWLTPNAITGEIGAVGENGIMIGGGITSQARGARLGRVYMRADKVNPGVLIMPTRYARLVVRTLCDPSNVNGRAAVFPANGTNTACLKRARLANGLYSGHYLAPTEFIFADNAISGDPAVAKDLWNMGFLINGEGGSGAPAETLAPGPLLPAPW